MSNFLKEVERITKGERFITLEQIEEIMELEGVYSENCGESGTGKGTLYTLYKADENGNQTDEEICEVVVGMEKHYACGVLKNNVNFSHGELKKK